MRAAVDVMGGDNAPGEILKGCFEAATILGAEDVVLLVGDEKVIRPALDAAGLGADSRYKVVHTTQNVAMDESPVEAIRSKPDSSIAVMCKLAAKGEADVVISAGNTGACVAAAQLRMRTLPGVSRPGIAVVLPTAYGPVVVCDAGANITPKPKHYQQNAIMASAYARAVCSIPEPRVGILSIGEEESKGTEMVKSARKLLAEEKQINFIGNVEGKDIFKGVVDVVVCDGFTGNNVLKTAEGMADNIFKVLLKEASKLAPEVLATVKPLMKAINAKYDWQEAGGAPLLGVGGYCLICHGRSEARAIKSAIRVGKQVTAAKVNERIVEAIGRSVQVADE